MAQCSGTVLVISLLLVSVCNAANPLLFREYIGAESDSIKLSDVPVNPTVDFHFIIAFAIDYNSIDHPSPTNGKFNSFWASNSLTLDQIASIKKKHPRVKVAIGLGGDSVGRQKAYFAPRLIETWVQNVVSSLTGIIKQDNFDGININYEHFKPDPDTIAECIGQLITSLKKSRVISFASIAPYEDDGLVQKTYLTSWKKYGHIIDYVNFQFFAYDKISMSPFVKMFNKQASNYEGAQESKQQKKLGGIFIWSADDSVKHGFSAVSGIFSCMIKADAISNTECVLSE